MIVTFQLREDYATCEYPPWFLALCKEYEIDFDYVRMKTHWGNVWVWVMNKIQFWKDDEANSMKVIILKEGNYPFSWPLKKRLHPPASGNDILQHYLLWCVWWEAVVQKWFDFMMYFVHSTYKVYISYSVTIFLWEYFLRETSSPSNNDFKPHPIVVCVVKGHCPKVNQPRHFMPTHKPSQLPISHILLKVYFSYSVTTFLWKYIYGETSMTSYGPPIVVCVVRAVVQEWFNRATLCRPINPRGFPPLLFSWSRQLAEPP